MSSVNLKRGHNLCETPFMAVWNRFRAIVPSLMCLLGHSRKLGREDKSSKWVYAAFIYLCVFKIIHCEVGENLKFATNNERNDHVV